MYVIIFSIDKNYELYQELEEGERNGGIRVKKSPAILRERYYFLVSPLRGSKLTFFSEPRASPGVIIVWPLRGPWYPI